MAYSTSSPPALVTQGVGDNRLWFYKSTDTATAVRVSGYITNGWDLGMRAGDLLMSVDTDASPIAMHMYIVTSASKAGGVDLSDGTAITATDSD